jgi:hypothetical protein
MIPSEKVVKFLGLYFEANLKWNHQVGAIRQECIQRMAILHCMLPETVILVVQFINTVTLRT